MGSGGLGGSGSGLVEEDLLMDLEDLATRVQVDGGSSGYGKQAVVVLMVKKKG